MTEKARQSFTAHAKHLCQGFGIEVRTEVGTVFFHAHLNDGHQLTVVLQVGIALSLDVAFEQFAGYFRTASQFHVVFQPFGKVEVSADESDEFVLEAIHFCLQCGILSSKLLVVGFGLFFFCHNLIQLLRRVGGSRRCGTRRLLLR